MVLSSILLTACGGGSESDVDAPLLTSVLPVDNATAVAVDQTITLTFNEAMAEQSIHSATIGVYSEQGWISGVIKVTDNVVTFDSDIDLTAGTAYTIYIASGVEDLAGNPLAATTQFSFTTDVIDVAPFVVSTYPNELAVAVFPSKIRVVFSEPMDASTVNSTSFSVSDLTGRVTYSGNEAVYHVDFSEDPVMLPAKSYTVTLDVSLLKDVGGNAMGSDYVWAFTTAVQTGAETLLELDDAGNAVAPSVVADDAGNALAVWQQYDGSWNSIYASYYPSGGPWAAPVLLDDVVHEAGASMPQLVMNPTTGNAMAVWVANDDSVYSAVYNAGWAAEAMVESEAGVATSPVIAMDGSGNVFAAWIQSVAGVESIYVNRYTGTWGAAQRVSAVNVAASQPVIATDSAGNALLLWGQKDDGLLINLYASYYTLGGSWSSGQLIEQSDAGDVQDASVVFDSDGNALAVWSQLGSEGYNPRLNLYSSYFTGSWMTPQLIENLDKGSAILPALAVDGTNNFSLLWQQHDGDRWDVYSSRYVAASGWQAPLLIDSDAAGDAIHPQLAVNSTGNAVATWQQYDGRRWNVWSALYDDALTSWAVPKLVEHDGETDRSMATYTQDAVMSAVSLDALGNVTSVWQWHDGSRYNIWANRY